MQRTVILLMCCLLLATLGGCGPLHGPMVPRLSKEAQKEVDDGWEKALAPVDHLDHQTLLDVFVGTSAYQLGVDKLTLRSEKNYSAGLVVMEITFEKADPTKDRFLVTIYDKMGKEIRCESYGREEVEKTYKDLTQPPTVVVKDGKFQKEAPDILAAKEAAVEIRWAKIREFFPKAKENQELQKNDNK